MVCCAPEARPVASVHVACGAWPTKLMLRRTKLLPLRVRTLMAPPENPPRATSYGEVETDDETGAARGTPSAPVGGPLSVVRFCVWSRPKTENPPAPPAPAGM